MLANDLFMTSCKLTISLQYLTVSSPKFIQSFAIAMVTIARHVNKGLLKPDSFEKLYLGAKTSYHSACVRV